MEATTLEKHVLRASGRSFVLTVFSLSSDMLFICPLTVWSFFSERGARVDSIFIPPHTKKNRVGTIKNSEETNPK